MKNYYYIERTTKDDKETHYYENTMGMEIEYSGSVHDIDTRACVYYPTYKKALEHLSENWINNSYYAIHWACEKAMKECMKKSENGGYMIPLKPFRYTFWNKDEVIEALSYYDEEE